MVFRPYPLLTVFTLVSLVILGWLGHWQYQRFEDKIARADAPPVETPMISVSIETLSDAPAQNVYGLSDGKTIWRRYVPGRINGVGDIVLVHWDAVEAVNPAPLSVAGLGTIERESIVLERPTGKLRFGQQNAPDENLWYAFDGPGLLAQFGYQSETVKTVEPARLTIRNGDNLSLVRETDNPYLSLKPMDPLPPQRHFGYAITWWGLGLALIAVYIALHISRDRLTFRGQS